MMDASNIIIGTCGNLRSANWDFSIMSINWTGKCLLWSLLSATSYVPHLHVAELDLKCSQPVSLL